MGDLIAKLVMLWFRWLENDKMVRDMTLNMSRRRRAAEECEKIVNEKYKVISLIDEYIDGYKRA